MKIFDKYVFGPLAIWARSSSSYSADVSFWYCGGCLALLAIFIAPWVTAVVIYGNSWQPNEMGILSLIIACALPVVIFFYLAIGTWYRSDGGHKDLREKKPEKKKSDKPEFDFLVRETLGICRVLRDDRSINSGWTDRAIQIEKLTRSCKMRSDAFAKMPSVSRTKLTEHMVKLHDAAVALAEYEMIAGITPHASIIENEVDLTLTALQELEVLA